MSKKFLSAAVLGCTLIGLLGSSAAFADIYSVEKSCHQYTAPQCPRNAQAPKLIDSNGDRCLYSLKQDLCQVFVRASGQTVNQDAFTFTQKNSAQNSTQGVNIGEMFD